MSAPPHLHRLAKIGRAVDAVVLRFADCDGHEDAGDGRDDQEGGEHYGVAEGERDEGHDRDPQPVARGADPHAERCKVSREYLG